MEDVGPSKVPQVQFLPHVQIHPPPLLFLLPQPHSHRPPSHLRLIPSRFFHSPFTSSNNTPSPWRIQQQSKVLEIGFRSLQYGFCMLLPFLVQLPHVWKVVFFVLMILTLACLGSLAVSLMNKGKRTKPVTVRGLRNCIPIIAACSLLFMLATCWAKQVWEFIS